MTPGQVMVASTVGKLSALLASDLSDEQAQRLGFDAILPRASATDQRCSVSIRHRVLPAVQRAGPLSQPALVDYRHPVAATGRADDERGKPR